MALSTPYLILYQVNFGWNLILEILEKENVYYCINKMTFMDGKIWQDEE